jgi:GxxExxY protein
MEERILFKEEVFLIIKSAINVFNELGSGFLEAVYQEALEMEFTDNQIPFLSQKQIGIKYKNRPPRKKYISDFLCYNQIIIEIKAINMLTNNDTAQILNYLKASGKSLGLLINFGGNRLEWKRYANTRKTGLNQE